MLEVADGGVEIDLTGQQFDILKGAARLADLPGRSGDKGSATGIEEQPTIPRAWFIGDETNGDWRSRSGRVNPSGHGDNRLGWSSDFLKS
jgi:hypothetical protein